MSSLLGWTELLRDRLGLAADAPATPRIAAPPSEEKSEAVVAMERALADEILYEMERDLELGPEQQREPHRDGHPHGLVARRPGLDPGQHHQVA